VIVRSFKKCSISNSLDGTEDEALWLDESDKESERLKKCQNGGGGYRKPADVASDRLSMARNSTRP
jgi:hypothetical protein